MSIVYWLVGIYVVSTIIALILSRIRNEQFNFTSISQEAFVPVMNTIACLKILFGLIVKDEHFMKAYSSNENPHIEDTNEPEEQTIYDGPLEEIKSWDELLSVFRNKDEGPGLQPKLKELFTYQSLFIALNYKKIHTTSWFRDIPFHNPSEYTIDKAREYARSTKLPGMFAMMGMTNETRYFINQSDNSVMRESNAGIDQMIVSVAECLKKYGNISGPEKICQVCFEAIQHYASLPIVCYFGYLPALEDSEEMGQMIISEAEMCLYRVVESLLLELYDEIGEGEIINDARVINKVSAFF
jgi:hypothetical protein